MRKVTATLIAHVGPTTGNDWVRDEVPLGKQYVVDLDSTRFKHFVNLRTKATHITPCVDVYDGDTNIGIMPLEILEIPGAA